MNNLLKLFVFLLLPVAGWAQQSLPDSLRAIHSGATDDSVIYATSIYLYDYYEEVNRDSAFYYASKCVEISRKNNKKINEAHVLTRKAYQELNLGRYAESLNSLLASFDIIESGGDDMQYWDVGVLTAEKEKKMYALNCAHHIYGILMRETLNQEQALIHFKEAKRIAVSINSYARSLLASLNMGRIYLEKEKYDSALLHENDAAAIVNSSGWKKYLSTILYYSGRAYLGNKDTGRALVSFRQCIESAINENNKDALTRAYHALSEHFLRRKQADSGVYYASRSLDVMQKLGPITQIEYHLGNAYEGLHHAYESNNLFDSAYKYLALAQSANDSISQRRIRSLAEFQKITLNEQQRLQSVEKEKLSYQNKVRTYLLLAGIGILLLLAMIFYRNNRQKHKAKLKIERAYEELQATQQQLIQAEKMASLGELTAGIAHEIQNPLNFVNNFSEVNTELIDEVKTQKDKMKAGELDDLLKDISFNNEKITHHGKRADAIVKGMLQHSRTGSGQKEMTDLNALVDEYVRLAYHGLKARDKNFSAALETSFDNNIGRINIIPQDIGRVILNLVNNAFYAAPLPPQGGFKDPDYRHVPTVWISTKKENRTVLISVRDNGPGIPSTIIDKIFQPFFTTKPTGQGTGLGLSLSYDIITKGHGGELTVETMEGEGTTFIVQLKE